MEMGMTEAELSQDNPNRDRIDLEHLIRIFGALSQDIALVSEETELYKRAVALIVEHLGLYHAQVFRCDANRREAVLVAAHGPAGKKNLDEGYRLRFGEGLVGTCAALGTSTLLADVASVPNYRPHPHLSGTRGELAIPIKLDQRDPHAQSMAVQSFADGGFDGFLLVAIDEKAILPIIRSATARGLHVVSTNVFPEMERFALVGYHDYDNGYALGVEAGQWATSHLTVGETLQLAMFSSIPAVKLADREVGIMEGIRASYRGPVELVETATEADSITLVRIARRWLEAWPDLHMILGINDNGALAGYAAVQEAGRNDADQFFVGGVDATDEALAAIAEDGAYQATVDQSPRLLGVRMVRTLAAMLAGHPAESRQYIPGSLVTRRNLEAFLARRQSAPDGGPDGWNLSGRKIGINVIDLRNPFFVAMIESAAREAKRLGVELVVNDSRQVLGVMSVLVDRPGVLGLREQRVLEVLCGQIATALKSLRLFAELKQARDNLEVRVQERTAELRLEIAGRERVEQTLRQSQQRYYALFDSASDALFVHDLAGHFLDVNQVACESLGYSRQELLQMSLADIDAPEDAALIEERIGILREHGQVVFEALHVTKDGSVIPVEVSARLTDYGGSPAVIGTARDMTERKQAQEALIQASRMEVAATLSAGIAHKVNNLMGGVLGYAELLREELSSRPDLLPDLQIISRSAEQASELARQMLAFARGGTAQLQGLDLGDVARTMIETQESSSPAGVQVVFDLAPDLWEVSADPRQIGQAFLNILTNAVEAVADEGKVTIVTRNVEPGEELPDSVEPGAYVSLAVEDTGHGMGPQVLARVFEPFYTTKFQGRGLGLPAAYGIIQNHGGHIAIDSQEGVGTQVTIYLPAVQPEQPSAPVVGDSAEADTPLTVLLVEDDATVRRFVRRLLDREGYQVLEAAGGQQAVDLAQGHSGAIDLVLLDIEMPDMDGVATYPLLVAAHPEAKVILCSGYDVGEREQALLDAGANGFLVKPFNLESLRASVQVAMGDR